MLRDIHLYTHLSELVLFCSTAGIIGYANPAAQHWCAEPVEGQTFLSLLAAHATQKGLLFLEATRAASAEQPSEVWELMLGDTISYTLCQFRGYRDADELVLIGQVEPEQVSAMQREMLALTSELTEIQRDQRRQNRALQQALDQQGRLLETIRDLTAPALPISKDALLLPMVGHMDSHRMHQLAEQLLLTVSKRATRYVILDVSGIVAVDTAVAQHLISTAQTLQLLGVQTVLVGISPEIAQTIVQLGIQLNNFVVRGDLQHAIHDVLRQKVQL